MTDELDRDAIISLLSELGGRLHAKGVDARFYVVGGAAMLLAYGRETMTRDIDAILSSAASFAHFPLFRPRRHSSRYEKVRHLGKARL